MKKKQISIRAAVCIIQLKLLKKENNHLCPRTNCHFCFTLKITIKKLFAKQKLKKKHGKETLSISNLYFILLKMNNNLSILTI